MKKLLPISLTIFTLLFFYSLTLITYPVLAVVDPECKPDKVSSERDPRPAPCNVCNTTDLLTPSCATSFEIFDKVEYNPIKEGPMVKKDWEGTITVNPEEIKIPFVGMKNKDSVAWWEISNASENEYLADYFEGTNEYYRNYGNQTTITNYQGVLRKLTPFAYQNQLKKKLITRAEEGSIHNYKIKYIGRLCWDTPFWIDAGKFVFEKMAQLVTDFTANKILAFFSHLFKLDEPPKLEINLPDIGHYCLYASIQEGAAGWFTVKANEFIADKLLIGDLYKGLLKFSQEIPGLVHVYLYETVDEYNLKDFLVESEKRIPPDPSDKDYQKKFLEWKEKDGGKWYRLWQATPMLSREDTQGEISPYLAKEHKEDTDLEFTSEEAKLESVPHLARLYEGSQIISNLLTPAGEKKIEMVKTEEIPETTPPNTCFKENYLPGNNEGDTLCCEPIKATFKAVEEFENPDYQKCQEALNKVKNPLAIAETLAREGQSGVTKALTTLSEECLKDREKEVSRGIGVNLKHPYLDEIWSYTANANGGFFNIFRPYGVPPFEDIAVAQTVKYSYDPGGFTSNGEASPQEGLFFFPHLGGVQKAKEYVVNQALWPYEEKK